MSVNDASASGVPAAAEACLAQAGITRAEGTTLTERVGVAGSSITFAYRAPRRGLYVCDAIGESLPSDPDRPEGSPWCGGSFGRTVGGRLADPRLHLCESGGGEVIGFAWVEPLPEARWVIVRGGRVSEAYEVAGPHPVRVITTNGARLEQSAASFAIEEYGADGATLREYTLDASVAG